MGERQLEFDWVKLGDVVLKLAGDAQRTREIRKEAPTPEGAGAKSTALESPSTRRGGTDAELVLPIPANENVGLIPHPWEEEPTQRTAEAPSLRQRRRIQTR